MQESPNRHLSKLVIARLLMALGGIGACVVVLMQCLHKDYFSSPDAVRPWAEDSFNKLVKPVASTGNPLDPEYVASYALVSKEEKSEGSNRFGWELHVQKTPAQKEYVPPYEVIDFDSSRGFATAEGKGTIDWISARTMAPEFINDRKHLMLGAFDVAGQPLSDAQIQALKITPYDLEQGANRMEAVTQLKWHGSISGFPEVKWQMQAVFDARTHVPLHRGFGWSSAEATVSQGTSLSIIHATPWIAVADFNHGPAEVVTCPFAEGAVAGNGKFQIQLLGIRDGDSASYGSGGDEKNLRLSFTGPKGTEKSACTFAYTVQPSAMANAVSIEAVDVEGKVIAAEGGMSGNGCASAKLKIPRTKIASLHIKYRPHFKRLIIRQAVLPGVPPANTSPLNLFDVVAPRVTFQSEFEMLQFIGEATELQLLRTPIATSAGFPITMQNVTPRQALKLILARQPGRRVEIDATAHTIALDDRYASLINKLPMWLRRLWP